MKATVFMAVMLLASLPLRGQDAAAMEEQYKTCAKHFIPAEKCTPEIYRQLKEKDTAPLDPKVAFALQGVKQYQKRLKNPESMQIHTAYVTDRGDACLEIGAQNSVGGQTVSRIVYLANGKFLDEGGFRGMIAQDDSFSEGRAGGVDRWQRVCLKGFHQKLVPGTDVTEDVKKAFKDGR
jgi:hypothetical protein